MGLDRCHWLWLMRQPETSPLWGFGNNGRDSSALRVRWQQNDRKLRWREKEWVDSTDIVWNYQPIFFNCKLLWDQNGVSIHNFHLFWENAVLSFESVYRIAISWAASKPGYNLNGETLKSDEGRICNKRYSSNTHQDKSSFPRTLWRHAIALGISCSKTAQ